MDQQQYELACEIVSIDCTLTGKMKDGKGNFCVLGGLYTAIDPDWAIRDDGISGNLGTAEMYRLIGETFSINVSALWKVNDCIPDLDERRLAVKAALLLQLEDGL